MAALEFLGAAGTVTGSKHLLKAAGKSILIDCGLFQGEDEFRDRRNERPFPVPIDSIDAVLITHAHLDHSGYLPKLAALGYRGKIYCTPSTFDLLEILLLDSAHLQEEEVSYHRDKNCCPGKEPFYTVQNATTALSLREPVKFQTLFAIGEVTVEFIPAGHILGSSFIRITVTENGVKTLFLFSGDIGRYGMPILNDPAQIEYADFLVLESTYGDRKHETTPRTDALLPAVEACLARSGCLLIPAFTVGRTQDILYTLRELLDAKKIPRIPVYVDSPMAIDVTHLYEKYQDECDSKLLAIEKAGRSPFHFPGLKYIRTVSESKTLNGVKGPMIIISANGMATGGRIMHHLIHRLPDPTTVLMFVGYQAEGTRGRKLLEGAKSVEIFHQEISVAAQIMQTDTFSAHGDYLEILQWLGGFKTPPETTFLVHGDSASREALRQRIAERFPGWKTVIPVELETEELSAKKQNPG